MHVLSGATIVLPTRLLSPGTLVVENGLIAEVREGPIPGHPDLTGHVIVPGFVDHHVHGVAGVDVQDDREAVAAVAARLPRFGVTAFRPTAVACSPAELLSFLAAVAHARTHEAAGAARVLPAHLESNFINPEYRGAQPAACVRRPMVSAATAGGEEGGFSAAEIVDAIRRGRSDLGVVTLAPELDGALALIEMLVADGVRVSLGHSGARLEEADAGIDRGARLATHLFNRMPPLHHREPGLAGAAIRDARVAAELVCDAYHVHPSMMWMAIAAKGPDRVMAITDGTACASLPEGGRATLGRRPIRVRGGAAYLDDGTLAGSTCTMDRAFRVLIDRVGMSLVDAARLCATTPAGEAGLSDAGRLEAGYRADLVVLDPALQVSATYVGGVLAADRHPRN